MQHTQGSAPLNSCLLRLTVSSAQNYCMMHCPGVTALQAELLLRSALLPLTGPALMRCACHLEVLL